MEARRPRDASVYYKIAVIPTIYRSPGTQENWAAGVDYNKLLISHREVQRRLWSTSQVLNEMVRRRLRWRIQLVQRNWICGDHVRWLSHTHLQILSPPCQCGDQRGTGRVRGVPYTSRNRPPCFPFREPITGQWLAFYLTYSQLQPMLNGPHAHPRKKCGKEY